MVVNDDVYILIIVALDLLIVCKRLRKTVIVAEKNDLLKDCSFILYKYLFFKE